MPSFTCLWCTFRSLLNLYFCLLFIAFWLNLFTHIYFDTAACPSFNISYPLMRKFLCPGDIITYTCTISSSYPTIYTQWTGSGFHCPATASSPENMLTLSQQTGASLNAVSGLCGNLFAVMTNISGTCYTSVLTIPTPQYFNGTTVTCKDGNSGTLIGNDTLNIQLACKLGMFFALRYMNIIHVTFNKINSSVFDFIHNI